MDVNNGVRENSGQRRNLRKGRKDGMEVGVHEHLTMEERKLRWRIVKAAKKERAKERKVVLTNREL